MNKKETTDAKTLSKKTFWFIVIMFGFFVAGYLWGDVFAAYFEKLVESCELDLYALMYAVNVVFTVVGMVIMWIPYCRAKFSPSESLEQSPDSENNNTPTSD